MKTIPESFTRNGFEHRILERVGNVLLVERKHHEVSSPHFEVVRIRIGKPKRLPDGTVLQEREVYPASTEWGTHGWTRSDLESARAKFKELTL